MLAKSLKKAFSSEVDSCSREENASKQKTGAPIRCNRIGSGFKAAFALLPLLVAPLGAAAQTPANDFPTEARADYVFACMAANGQTSEALRKCACSIDVVATILPYDRYVEAETILSMRQGVGRQATMFRAANFEEVVADLRRAQAEGEIRCFN